MKQILQIILSVCTWRRLLWRLVQLKTCRNDSGIEYISKRTLRHVGFEEHSSSLGRNNAAITRVTVAHAPIKLTKNLSEVHNAWTWCVGQSWYARHISWSQTTIILASFVLVIGNEHTDLFIELVLKIYQCSENISDAPFD